MIESTYGEEESASVVVGNTVGTVGGRHGEGCDDACELERMHECRMRRNTRMAEEEEDTERRERKRIRRWWLYENLKSDRSTTERMF